MKTSHFVPVSEKVCSGSLHAESRDSTQFRGLPGVGRNVFTVASYPAAARAVRRQSDTGPNLAEMGQD